MKRCITLILFAWSLVLGAQEARREVLIETSLGNIRIQLYNETPLHRDNFIKLAEKKFYDSLLFHRVIRTFMIQGGDPDSKNAPSGKFLGEGDVGYTIPAEFNPKLFHKRGALAAARNGDEENPDQASSGCQFYIVHGKTFNDSLLGEKAKRITRMKAYNMAVRDSANKETVEKLVAAIKDNNPKKQQALRERLGEQVDKMVETLPPYEFTEEQKNVYATEGGAPHLDSSYTVFGEVVEGMEVVDAITKEPTDGNNRPQKNVWMKISVIK